MDTTLTIRLDSRLKKQAEEACAALDTSLSQFLRKSLRGLVAEASRESRAGARLQEIAMDKAIESRAMKDLAARRLLRISELEKLEKLNGLNKVTRAELKQLRFEEATK